MRRWHKVYDGETMKQSIQNERSLENMREKGGLLWETRQN